GQPGARGVLSHRRTPLRGDSALNRSGAARSGETMYTSCFSRARLIVPPLEAVSIARWPPRSWKGRREYRLAPAARLLKSRLSFRQFVHEYRQQLAALDPQTIAGDLTQNAVLLCFEPPGAPCHRRIVAEWLEGALGVPVPELMVRALTVRQPWANEIIRGEKTIECRSRSTAHRGLLVIHASKKRCTDCSGPYGAIVGTVRLVDCYQNALGEWCWALEGPRP